MAELEATRLERLTRLCDGGNWDRADMEELNGRDGALLVALAKAVKELMDGYRHCPLCLSWRRGPYLGYDVDGTIEHEYGCALAPLLAEEVE